LQNRLLAEIYSGVCHKGDSNMAEELIIRGWYQSDVYFIDMICFFPLNKETFIYLSIPIICTLDQTTHFISVVSLLNFFITCTK
jgi:hypothetical protein